MLYTLLIVLLILMLIGPNICWWGWGPSGIGGFVLLVVLILLLTGRL